jgi:hypothetical protein
MKKPLAIAGAAYGGNRSGVGGRPVAATAAANGDRAVAATVIKSLARR